MRDYHKQLYANKMDNLEEMETLLEKYNLPRLKEEETDNMKRPITSTEIETVIKNLPTNKSPGPDGFTGEFSQRFREEVAPILLKFFQNIAGEEHCQTHSTRQQLALYQNQTKMSEKKKTTGQYL